MERFYRRRLLDETADTRRLVLLVKALPADSALARATGRDWKTGDELLASLVELAQGQIIATLRVAGATDVPPVAHVPRPYEPKPEPQTHSLIEKFRRMFGEVSE